LTATSFSALRSGAASTVVVVSHRASSLSASQLLPGPTTTTVFGRTVCPSGNESSSVTEKVSVTVAPGAIDGIVQLRTSVVSSNEQPPEQSALYSAWARMSEMSSYTGTFVATQSPLFLTVIL
jgi:hypothetical protein